MVTLHAFLVRRADLSHEEFLEHWRDRQSTGTAEAMAADEGRFLARQRLVVVFSEDVRVVVGDTELEIR